MEINIGKIIIEEEFSLGEIILEGELFLGDIELDITKEYLGMEPLTVIPGANEKFFKPKKYAFSDVTVKGVKIIDDYLNDDKFLELTLEDGSIIKIDISKYIDNWRDIILALNDMLIDIETGDLIMDYNDIILDFIFSISNGDLIVDNNIGFIDFYINDNNELEVRY